MVDSSILSLTTTTWRGTHAALTSQNMSWRI
jgi:hypothetical protein